MFLKKTIAYLEDLKRNALVGFILGAILACIIIFLEPFDSEGYQASYKMLRLAGYGVCMWIPIVFFHYVENSVYRKQGRRWYILNEIIYTVFVFFVIMSLCGVYNFYVVNENSGLQWKAVWSFLKVFGLPFIPIIFPIWIYLRSNWGKIEISQNTEPGSELKIVIGDNKSERLQFSFSEFVFAQAQQNYVTINLNTPDGVVQKMVRMTLSNLRDQLPEAWQVHRSYLVNLAYLDSVSGNSRKREMHLSLDYSAIPISQKYYQALQNHLAISSQ